MNSFKTLATLLLIGVFAVNSAFLGNSYNSEIRKVKSFQAIKVSAGIDLYITMGDKEEVKIVADADLIDEVKTEVKDGTLVIYMKNSGWFNWNRSGSRKAYVTVKELNAITASSGSDVRSENTLQGESLKVKASSGSDVRIDVIYKNFSIDMSSGSDARLSGKVKRLEAEASSGSDIKARELSSVICKARVSSGADITVSVSGELYAHASSGGDIRYYGSPEIQDIEESSGGDVTRK